eukprot:TRINITY_DN17074_c0_g1_i1.p1 TRINITY_DN17074_c0_g1~~TRINITY_DN17074_c0_g1_i1.p1  ORF type:complete len:425 (-),score=69.71 TRINITY_DN17074_c0_g1_i1:11-1285(-)
MDIIKIMLPNIVISEIMKNLNVREVLILSGLCKRFYSISQNQLIWEYLGKRDFGDLLCYDYDDFESERGWISSYIFNYQHCNVCNTKYDTQIKKVVCIKCNCSTCDLCAKNDLCTLCIKKSNLIFRDDLDANFVLSIRGMIMKNQKKEVLALLTKEIQTKPHFCQIFFEIRGGLYFSNAEFKLSLKDINFLFTIIDKPNPQQLFYRMKIYQRIGETQKSIDDGNKLLEMIGDNPKSYHKITRAGALSLLNRPYEALKELETAQIDCKDIEIHLIYIERCRVYILLGEWEKSVEDAIRVKQSETMKISTWITSANIEISRCYAVLGKIKESISTIEETEENEESKSSVQWQKGILYYLYSDKEKGKEFCIKNKLFGKSRFRIFIFYGESVVDNLWFKKEIEVTLEIFPHFDKLIPYRHCFEKFIK